MIKIKICGITNLQDALKAAALGVHAIGIRIRPKLVLSEAKRIVDSMPPLVTPVLVTPDDNLENVIKTAKFLGISTIQLYSLQSEDNYRVIRENISGVKIISALPITSESAIDTAKDLMQFSDALLLDSRDNNTGKVGGTGMTHDWGISSKIVKISIKPVFLAGGLNPQNIEDAIRTVNCWGVDCESGVEKSDGIKDFQKMETFVSRVINCHHDKKS